MLNRTKLAIVAVAVLGFASSAVAAPRHMHHSRYAHWTKHHTYHARHMHHGRLLRTSAYPRDMYLYSPAWRGYAGYPDKYCTSCNLGSY